MLRPTRRSVAAAFALAAAMLTPSFAADAEGVSDPKIVAKAKALAGVYAFEPKDQSVTPCVMLLDTTGSYDIFNIWLSPGCEGSYSFLGALSAWEPMDNGGIRLLGAETSLMGEFKREVNVGYVGTVENDGKVYVLSQMMMN